MNENMADFEATAEDGAVNVYQNDMADEFPVLKAFQQYIDAEQAKARKRMLMLCVFFSFVLMIVIGVFVSLLIASSSRNQSLNDRLVEYAMKDRDRSPAPAQPSQDDPALRALTEKLEMLQKTLAEDQARAKKVEEEAERKKRSTAETLEIERLKALLAAEKEKAAAEREKQRQAELEEYRRKHYPELYGLKPVKASKNSISRKSTLSEDDAAADREIESIINDIKAIDYFDEEEDEERRAPSKRSTEASRRKVQKKDAAPSEDDVEVPNEVKDSSGNTWSIPEE